MVRGQNEILNPSQLVAETPKLITKMCKNCLCEKSIEKFQAKTRVCISCRNKKYYKKEYFHEYYLNHSDKIKADSSKWYIKNVQGTNPRPVGRPKKSL